MLFIMNISFVFDMQFHEIFVINSNFCWDFYFLPDENEQLQHETWTGSMAQIHKYICQSDGSFGCLEEIDYQQRRVNIFYIYLLRFHVIFFLVNSTLNNDHRKRAINFGEKWIKSVFNLPLIYSFQLLTTHLSLSRIIYFNWGCRRGWARFGTSKIFIVPKV